MNEMMKVVIDIIIMITQYDYSILNMTFRTATCGTFIILSLIFNLRFAVFLLWLHDVLKIMVS